MGKPNRETQYREQLIDLGVYHPAFDPLIHDLCILERELSRTMKAYKADGSDPTGDLYRVITQQRRDILSYRDSLGLSPKGFQRMRKAAASGTETASVAGTASPGFAAVLEKIREAAHA